MPWRYSSCLALVCCWKRSACRWRWARFGGRTAGKPEYRHALESDIEPFKGLLLGLFFIGVGMSIDFGTLLENPLRIVILLLGFLIIKIAMLWLIARPLQVPNKQRRWFAVLLAGQ